VDTSLNKKQLQETLRQMGIDYPSTASKEDLIKRLEQENQNQWMRAANSGNSLAKKRVLRRKGEPVGPEFGETRPEGLIDKHSSPGKPSVLQPKKQVLNQRPTRKMETVEPKLEPDFPGESPSPIIPSVKELERYALKRADGVCDLCETTINKQNVPLMACFFMDPPEEGKHRTAKEVVALCSNCFNRVQSQHLAKDIKILKRKARQKRIREVKISKR
jgi:hypothetical protein